MQQQLQMEGGDGNSNGNSLRGQPGKSTTLSMCYTAAIVAAATAAAAVINAPTSSASARSFYNFVVETA